jgi:hypothetical protein
MGIYRSRYDVGQRVYYDHMRGNFKSGENFLFSDCIIESIEFNRYSSVAHYSIKFSKETTAGVRGFIGCSEHDLFLSDGECIIDNKRVFRNGVS